MNQAKRYSPEVREPAVRLLFEHEKDYRSRWAATVSIASKIGCTPDTLRGCVRRVEIDTGRRDGLTSEDRPRLRALEKENKELNREGVCVARCTVARLMKTMGMEGVRRGRRTVTTRPGEAIERPPDVVHRNFTAARPNALWVADLTNVATWRGFVYVAFVIDAFARRIGDPYDCEHNRVRRSAGV